MSSTRVRNNHSRQWIIDARLGRCNRQDIAQPCSGLHPVGEAVDFAIAANGVTVPIVHTGSQPQLFKAGVPVVLEGHWSADGTYYASDTILVKHDENYKTAHPDRLKQAGATQ